MSQIHSNTGYAEVEHYLYTHRTCRRYAAERARLDRIARQTRAIPHGRPRLIVTTRRRPFNAPRLVAT
jgi:hypothetical protein